MLHHCIAIRRGDIFALKHRAFAWIHVRRPVYRGAANPYGSLLCEPSQRGALPVALQPQKPTIPAVSDLYSIGA